MRQQFRVAVQVKSLHKAGLYLHIPFCQKKCAYCDFYSSFANEKLIDEYITALMREIKGWGGSFGRPIDSIYIGGGTPSLLGDRIIPLMDAVKENFEVCENSEITAEMNPTGNAEAFLKAAREAGVNRLSIGVQSGIDKELKALGRTHTAEDACECIELARNLGFQNISLDIMLGLQGSTSQSLKKSIDFILTQEPEHISAYILKIEENTRFYKENVMLPCDDEVAEQYLFLCDELRAAGYDHYEISNFAKGGFESRHNLKYWQCEEYLGIGPAAHSFVDGKRFYYERDLRKFINCPETVLDGVGEEADKIMLGLRLKEGVDLSENAEVQPFLEELEKAGLGGFSSGKFHLTDKGMLVSNSIIMEIMEKML